MICLTSKRITFKSKLNFFILIDLFKVYFKLKLIPLRSKLKFYSLNFARPIIFIFQFFAFGRDHMNGLNMRLSLPSFCVTLDISFFDFFIYNLFYLIELIIYFNLLI